MPSHLLDSEDDRGPTSDQDYAEPSFDDSTDVETDWHAKSNGSRSPNKRRRLDWALAQRIREKIKAAAYWSTAGTRKHGDGTEMLLVFKQFDKDGNGLISWSEFRKSFRK